MHLFILYKRITNFNLTNIYKTFDNEGQKELRYKQDKAMRSTIDDIKLLFTLFFLPFVLVQVAAQVFSYLFTFVIGSFRFDPTQRWFRACTHAALFQAADCIVAMEPAVSAGRFELTERFSNREEYSRELHTILMELRAKALVVSPVANVHFMRYISQLTRISKNLELGKFDASLRQQPFGILIEGYPGTGKSATAMLLAQRLCAAQGKALRPSEIVVLNETDEFQSEYRSNHRVVIFDDVGATRCNLDGKDPWRKVIDFINNITKTSLNPHLELKGNILIRPELVICTTNLTIASNAEQSSELGAVLNCPGAVLRRFKAYIKTSSFENWTYTIPTQHPANSREYSPDTKFSEESRDKTQILEKVTACYQAHCDEQELFIAKVNDGFLPETCDNKLSIIQKFKNYFTDKLVAQPAIVAQGGSEEVHNFQYSSQSGQRQVTDAYRTDFDVLRLPFLKAFQCTDLLKLIVLILKDVSKHNNTSEISVGLSKQGVCHDGDWYDLHFEQIHDERREPIFVYTLDEVCSEIAARESDIVENHHDDSIVDHKTKSELSIKQTLLQEILSQFDHSSTLLPNGAVLVELNGFEFRIFPFVEYGMSASDARALCKAMTGSDKQFWFTIGYGPIYSNALKQRATTCMEFSKLLRILHPLYKKGLANISEIRSLR